MQHPSSNVNVWSEVSSDPRHVLNLTRSTLEAEPVKANVILPILLKCAQAQEQGHGPSDPHVWIVTYTGDSYGNPTIVLIASITSGLIGRYPLFLFTPIPYAAITTYQNIVLQALRLTVMKLSEWGQGYSRRRIYSVFGQENITRKFADLWTSFTRIKSLEAPYYHAHISYANSVTVAQYNTVLPTRLGETILIKPAEQDDVNCVAKLCHGFAKESHPFTLTLEQAYEEAEILINNREVWVYYVQQGHSKPKVASIVAFTRNTPNAATITKVYTDPEFRKQRRAEHIVREVCQYLLSENGGKSVVSLFVGVENVARKVYAKVGFVGLDSDNPSVEGIDPWIEIGFDLNQVELGHW